MNGEIEFDNASPGGFVAQFNLPEAAPASGVQPAENVAANYEASLAGRR
jgi:hypothetical protein